MRLTQSLGGFSLIEMAIVVLLMSIMLTMGMAAFDAQQSSAAFNATQKKQEIIKDALVAYLRANRRLPCPETKGLPGIATIPTGNETRTSLAGTQPDTTTLCTSYVGTLPWLDLGLGKDIALDGYGNFFTYFVASSNAIGTPDWTLTAVPGTVPGFNVGNSGRFAITENGVATQTGTDLRASPALAVVVLISHGKNGNGAITVKGTALNAGDADSCEQANIPAAVAQPPNWNDAQIAAYATMLPPRVTTTLFVGKFSTCSVIDDVVMVLRPNDLLTPLIKDGALKSTEALVQEQLANARDIAINNMLSDACTPVATGSLSGLPTDPWGATINYARPATGNTQLNAGNQATLSTTNAFSIWSSGPDRLDNSGAGDDRTLQTGLNVTYGQILSRISSTACP